MLPSAKRFSSTIRRSSTGSEARRSTSRPAQEAKLSDDIDPRSGPLPPVAPCFEPLQRIRQFEIGMAFGMTGHADGRNPVRLEQATAADVARRLEWAPGRRNIARDQQDP